MNTVPVAFAGDASGARGDEALAAGDKRDALIAGFAIPARLDLPDVVDPGDSHLVLHDALREHLREARG